MESPTESDLKKLCHFSQIHFACFCAEQVFYLVEPQHQLACRQAIDIAKLFIEGKATKEECRAAYADAATVTAAYAANAAYYAAANTAANTAYAAAYAATAAANAAYATANAATKNKQAVVEAQWEYYKELLAFETIVEDVLLA